MLARVKGSIIPPTGARNERPVEIVYESQTTLVFRQVDVAGSVICKKPLGPDAARRQRHESTILTRLASTFGVVRLAPGKWPDGLMVMQDCGGVPLAKLLRSGPLEITTTLALAPQMAQATAGVHRAGVIHRDINPANVLLAASGEPVLIDFGLSLPSDQRDAVSGQEGVVGTLAYLAPEQSGRTGRAVDHRADLYALGAMLYEMATGRAPFESSDALQLIHDHMVREPVPPSHIDARVPRGLSDIIMRLLAKAPEQRYQSAEGLQHDLERLRGEPELRESGAFELGERDFPVRLVAPTALVGRDAELAMLRAALADALRTQRRTVLIEGAPGVGKSALINELRPLVAAAGGRFIHGKFDQYQRDAAANGGFTQALRALGRLLLSETKEELDSSRERIREALGVNAGLITRIVPEFELLLGAQPLVAEVDPRLVETRLLQTTVDLLGAVAWPQRPLVLVLDDLQWSGALSLNTFERIMNAAPLRGLLLVGAYRNIEAGAQHALGALGERWREQDQPPNCIALQNLNLGATTELIGAMLRLQPDRAAELAQAVTALTAGNPFDTVEMINALRTDGVLALRPQGWHWDTAAIKHYVGRGNVVDLLAVRIGRMPAASRALLESMSCLGGSPERALLQAATGVDAARLDDKLGPPLEDGLLVADITDPEIIHFRHDRVQQAVLGPMDDVERKRIHVELARRLAELPHYKRHAAQQYLEAIGLAQDAQEQRRAARLFLEVAQELAGAAEHAPAERYLTAANSLLTALSAQEAPTDAGLLLAIDKELHVAHYSIGRLDDADAVYEAIRSRELAPLDMIEPTCLQMRCLEFRGRAGEAIAMGLELLTRLGVPAPSGFEDATTAQRLDALAQWVRDDSAIDHASRAQILQPHLLAVAKLLSRLVRSAYLQSDMKAVAWLLLECQRLWSQHGPCPDLVASMGRIGILLARTRLDWRTGFDAVRHVVTVGEALGYEPQTSEARAVFAAYSCSWFEPLETTYQHAARAYTALRYADVSYACFVRRIMVVVLLDVAPTIDICKAEVEAGLAVCELSGNAHAAAMYTCDRQFLCALCGGTTTPGSFDDDDFDEQAFAARTAGMPQMELLIHARHAWLALVMGDLHALDHHGARTFALQATDVDVEPHLYVALARAWQLQRGHAGEPANRSRLLAELDACRDSIAQRAANQPYNYLHLLRLVDAERAWALGDMSKSAALFDEALLEADDRERAWHRAFIAERAGLFQQACGLRHAARSLLARARGQYEAWGASVKVKQMEQEHVFLQVSPPTSGLEARARIGAVRSVSGSGGVSAEMMDLVGVLRASQALSSETIVEKLTDRVSETLATMTGATRVCVLSWQDEAWRLLTRAAGESPPALRGEAAKKLIPMSAIAYAERTGEALVVDDVRGDDRFAHDPYFADVPLCSLLVVPIASQGVRAMLLLENRQGRAAFNAQRLDAVMLIAGQLAVSLANAQLYESLERRVQARTRELEQTQAQLVDTARRAGKAEIANNVLHNVGNVLNSINVSASIVRSTIANSRIEGLTRAVGLMNEHESDLPGFMANDPRGKVLRTYLNELVSVLGAERQSALGDLDRLTRSVEHITYVVATQQSHAGPSSVLEMLQPQELLEEALRLSVKAIGGGDLVIERHYEHMSDAALDRPRLLQILVNLIGNAVQAMESAPKPSRLLTLGTGLVQGEAGERLSITVQDMGEGIPPENLTRIFAHGFTTRKSGHGFGLHSSALAAVEMGGRLTVHSDGLGRGAVFTLELPIESRQARR